MLSLQIIQFQQGLISKASGEDKRDAMLSLQVIQLQILESMLSAPLQDELGDLERQYNDILTVFKKIDVAYEQLKFNTFHKLGQINKFMKSAEDLGIQQGSLSNYVEKNDEKLPKIELPKFDGNFSHD